jgi:hypothetical protein
MAILPSFIPAVVAARQRTTIRKFQTAGADDASRARTLEELGVRDGHLLGRLVRAGVLATVENHRYFLSADGLARWERRRRFAVLIATGVVLIGALIALAVAGP